MCMDSSLWLLNIHLIRVFLCQAQEETLYVSVTSDHAYHLSIKESYSLELGKKLWNISPFSMAKGVYILMVRYDETGGKIGYFIIYSFYFFVFIERRYIAYRRYRSTKVSYCFLIFSRSYLKKRVNKEVQQKSHCSTRTKCYFYEKV